jgi:hypothetical protein
MLASGDATGRLKRNNARAHPLSTAAQYLMIISIGPGIGPGDDCTSR